MPGLLWVCVGGALGSGARFLISSRIQESTEGAFPLGTLGVNLIGSFLLGVVMFVSLELGWLGPQARMAVAVGLLGGFTTYSTFSYETSRLMLDGAWGPALLNIALTLVLGLAATCAGLLGARWLAGS